MEDLIKALLIFKKYRNEKFPTHCEHDTLLIMSIGETEMDTEDTKEVKSLGFYWSDEYDCWASSKFGRA